MHLLRFKDRRYNCFGHDGTGVKYGDVDLEDELVDEEEDDSFDSSGSVDILEERISTNDIICSQPPL